MSEQAAPDVVRSEVLPDQTRLLHVGLMKTGTTAIQRAASARRELLLTHGVRYPGRRYNHRRAAMALMRRSDDTGTDEWSDLMTEIRADPERRIMISNEFIAEWDDPIASRFLDSLGPRTHVVITLRGVAEILPSIWQQTIKTGSTDDLDTWLRSVLTTDPEPLRLPPAFARHDQARVVRRWVELAGPERVTVIIGSRAEPRRIEASFEDLLGLPSGTLETSGHRGFDTNRSLGLDEAALVLRVNQLAAPYGIGRDDLVRVFRNGALGRVLDQHAPVGRIGLPDWAEERAMALGRDYATTIAASGARVLGDLDDLGRPAAGNGRAELPTTVDVDLAAQALVGALLAARTRPPEPVPPAPAPRRPMIDFSNRFSQGLQRTLRKLLRPLSPITKS